MGTRTQAQRDAMTTEIGYALFSAFVLSLGAFGAVVIPDLFLDLSPFVERNLPLAGAALAAVVFVVRVVLVLWRYQSAPGTQPNQPGHR